MNPTDLHAMEPILRFRLYHLSVDDPSNKLSLANKAGIVTVSLKVKVARKPCALSSF